MTEFLTSGPENAPALVLLAHGAGAPMDSPFMNDISSAIAARQLQVGRFEFAYMAARRNGSRKPPPRAERLTDEFLEVVRELNADKPVFAGGKSMGGRVASMVADDLFKSRQIAGLVCLGYPFHPPAKPTALRTAHLESLSTPSLICQGTRDPFGTKEQVEAYALSGSIDLYWVDDGDHDFKPRKSSGLTHTENIDAVADRLVQWVQRAAVDTDLAGDKTAASAG